MEYKPVKDKIANLMRKRVVIRKFLYLITGIVFLREWYIKRVIIRIYSDKKHPAAILDAGSGFGQYCYFCKRKYPGAEILGVDINKNHIDDCIRFANKAGLSGLKFLQKDLTEIDYEDEFDLILSIDVLEHIKDDSRLLSILNRAVKPGGIVVISTPTLYRKHHEDGEFVGEHERDGYSEDDIIGKLKESGFKNISLIYSYGWWGDLSWRMGIRNFMKIAGIKTAGRIIAPIYFFILFPVVFLFMVFDFFRSNRKGTGFVITAGR